MSKPSSHVTSNPRENVEESEEATMVIWLCDYCKEARYDTFDECQIHEEQECPKNVVRVLAAAGRSSSSDKDEEQIDEEARVRAELQESEVEGKSNEHGDDSINQNTTEEDPTTAANNEKPTAKESDQNKRAKERECGEYKAKSMFSTPDSTEGCEIVQGVERNDDECHVCRLEGVEQTEDFENVVCCDTCDKVYHKPCLQRSYNVDVTSLPETWSCPCCPNRDTENTVQDAVGTRSRRTRAAWECHFCSRRNPLQLLNCPECDAYKGNNKYSTWTSTAGCKLVEEEETNDCECHVCKLDGVEQTEDFEGVVCCDTCDKVIHERCLGRRFGIKEDAEALPDPWSCPFCQGMAIEPKQQKRKERTTPARKGAPNTTPFAKANKVTPMKQTERAANRDRPPAWANSSATTPITTVKRPTLLGTLEISQKKQKVGEASKVAAASVSTIETEQAANRANGDMVEEDKSVQQQLKDNHEEIQLLKNVIKEKNSELNDKNDWIETKEDELAKKNEELAKKDSELAKKDEKISRLKEAIHRLTSAL
ncbi:predicted protein [Thalassiosira pseudonana CCMP1335]|uniref:PHD-type domain-containing protein n=1 Tax=Thalassiosira pseudonana TaxID=35128 RepID=B8C4S2_THAPS|nr:predicted protein [Thalassiosira pseudonana CCMP1335]EED91775.1 predicted protein [Thalassiosira pseudonana CCMP1335]